VSRYTIDSFTTASVAGAGGSLDFSRTILQNYVDIFKIKITPSGGTGTTEFYIHKSATRDATDLIYSTKAFTTDPFVDPIESNAGVYTERNEGFVCRYEDDDIALSLWCRLVNNDAGARTYDIEITYAVSPFAAAVTGVPADLEAAGMANGLNCQSAVIAYLNSESIDQAEFRAIRYNVGEPLPAAVDLRTVSEGGTFVHDGVKQLIITGNNANEEGSVYAWISANDGSTEHGRWYFAWKMHNSVGWSKWTDGNDTPEFVTQFFDTTLNEDTGPPSGWQVTIQKGSATGYWVVHATRPAVNGNLILWWVVQVKDGSTGSWRTVDANAGAAVTKYDGSLADHTYDPATGEWGTPTNWGSAAVGDLIVYDVRGDGNWTLANCQWATVSSIGGTTMYHQGGAGNIGLLETATKALGVYTQVRMKIVTPPWEWITEGYLGTQPNAGIWEAMGPYGQPLFDTQTKEFVSDAIYVPPAITDVEARVWFQNGYSRSDDGATHSGTDDGGNGIVADGFTWTAFNDRNWWIPVCQQTDHVELVLEADGTVTGQPLAAICPASNVYGFAGVMSRFRVFPSTASGEIILTAKFTINLPDQLDLGNDICLAFLLADLEFYNVINYGWDRGAHLFGAVNHSSTSGPTNQRLGIGHLSGWDHEAYLLTRSSNIYEEIDPAPTYPCVLDLHLEISEDYTNMDGDAAGGICVWKTYSYQIDGAGWNTITIPSPGINYERWASNQGIKGYRIGLGYYQLHAIAGTYVTVEEFAIITGYAARM